MELLATTGDAFVKVGAWTRLEGSGAQCLAVNGDAVYVGCRGHGLKRSVDRGDAFEDLPLREQDVFSVAVGPDGTVYAGTEPSRLFCSRDGGDSWEELAALQDIPSRPNWSFPPRPWTSHVRWIAPSPHEPEVVLVGIELGGLMRTDDDGASFSDHRPEAARDVTGAGHPTRRSTAGRVPAHCGRSRARSTPTSMRSRPGTAPSSPASATARCSRATTVATAGVASTSAPAALLFWLSGEVATSGWPCLFRTPRSGPCRNRTC